MSNLFQEFIVRFSEHGVPSINTSLDSREEKLISIRDKIRQQKTISESKLREMVTAFFSYDVSPRNQKILNPYIYNRDGTLTPEFIKLFKEEVGLNSIKRHPGRTVAAFLLTGGIAVGLTFLGVFVFEVINVASLLAYLVTTMPFMAALGPLGAILLLTAFVLVGSLLVCGAVVGITAKVTEKTITVTPDDRASFNDSVGHMRDLHSGGDEHTVVDVPLASARTVLPPANAAPRTSLQPLPEVTSQVATRR
jgi:hypothetical protein